MSERILDNKYIIDHLIGIGRTSFMYKAWDIMLQKFVTVKKIHEEYASDPEFARIFRNEAVNTAKMEHENIVRVVNFIEEDGDFYIIMDYVKGVSLEYFLSKTIKLNKPIEPAVGTYMILQILRALDYAHKLKDEVSGELYNIIHQDISTANIVIFFDGRVKLTDFGITKKTGADIKDGEVSAYISPEQAAGAEISPLTDVYSAALILYEILSGEKPYGQRASSSEIVDKALKASVDLGSLMAGGVPEGIVSIISRALQKDPAARYPDAAAMCAELNSALRQMGEKDSALQKKHSHFIQLMLQDEIRAAEIEVQKDLEKKYDTEDKSAMSPFVPPPPAQMSVPEPIEEPAIPELSERSPGIPSIAPRPTPVGNNRREPLKDFMTAPTSPSLDPPKPVEPVSPEPPPIRPAAPSPQPARPAVQPTVGTIRKEESPDFESAEKTSGFEKMVFIGKILLACFFAGFTIYALLDIRGGREAREAEVFEEAERAQAVESSRKFLTTIPPISEVIVLDEAGRNVLEKLEIEPKTPFDLSKVGFGNYTVKVRREGFGEITRRLTVMGAGAGKDIRLHDEEEDDGKFVLKFKTDVSIYSVPSGAQLTIDGQRMGSTPRRLSLDAGKHNFMLSKSGYITAGSADLEGVDPMTAFGVCLLDTTIAAGEQYTYDRRFWRITESVSDGGKRVVIRGYLKERPVRYE